MRGAILTIGSLLLAFSVAVAADPPGPPPETKSANISSARDLLSRFSSPAEEDCALGYVMGVYGVHEHNGVLPTMPVQRQIAEVVKGVLLGASEETLDRSANTVVEEILEKEKAKLDGLTAGAE